MMENRIVHLTEEDLSAYASNIKGKFIRMEDIDKPKVVSANLMEGEYRLIEINEHTQTCSNCRGKCNEIIDNVAMEIISEIDPREGKRLANRVMRRSIINEGR